MKTAEFIDSLRRAGGKTLRFLNQDGDTVRSGYHLTEIKAASYDTVDCGGQTNHWKETIFQLWVPDEADDGYMEAGKFVRIFERVRSAVSVDLMADVRIEYGDENFFPSIYSVESIKTNGDSLDVALARPETTCKARDRRAAAPTTEPCCS
jgi:hypothetical protein